MIITFHLEPFFNKREGLTGLQPNGCRAVKSSLRRKQVTYPSTKRSFVAMGVKGNDSPCGARGRALQRGG